MTEALTVAQLWESIVVTIAVLTGGLWALYKFFSGLQAALEIRIRTTKVSVAELNSCMVEVRIEITNKGTRNVRLPWETHETVQPLKIYAVNEQKGMLRHERVAEYSVPLSVAPDSPARATIVRAGAMEHIPFLLRLKHDQLYLLTFVAHLSERDRRRSHKLGARRPTNWTARAYFKAAAPAA